MGKLIVLLLKSKFLLTGGSMLVSIAVYAQMYGWPYAVGFVLLIFVHEMGHFIAARQRGLKVGAPTFIPFVGAWIAMKEQPHDVETEAYVGLAGPLVGSLGALACYYAGRHYQEYDPHTGHFLLSLAYSGFIINLFNLLPVSPLDGGRVTAVLSPRIWLLGAPLLLALSLWRPSPIFILIGIMSYPHIMRAWHYNPKAPENAAYYQIKAEDRLAYMLFYLGLTAFLGFMAYDLHVSLRGH